MFYDATDLSDGTVYLKLLSTTPPNRAKLKPPAYNFRVKLNSDKSEIGQCSLRLTHGKYNLYSGNISYSIYKTHRGHGYAQNCVRLLLSLAARHNMKYVLICVSKENTASRRTSERLGASFKGVFDVPKWHPLYIYGKHQVLRYALPTSIV